MKRRGIIFAVTAVTLALLLAFLFRERVPLSWRPGSARTAPRSQAGEAPRPTDRVGLVRGRRDALRVPDDVARFFGLQTAAARPPGRPRTLALSGSLALDATLLAHVHTRFVGEVVELGMIRDPLAGTSEGESPMRPLRFGDHVEKDRLLAVLWSSELGEKKSDYLDALSRLRLERETLARLEQLYRDAAIAERNLREARRNVEAAEIAVAREERTLRTWRLSDAEIAAIRADAERLRGRGGAPPAEADRSWARVELRAPLAGTILERNLALGDIVDTTTDLFKIADLSRLRVWAYIYEEDLPTLLSLPGPIPWTVRLKSDPASGPLRGRIEKIGDMIDPRQHTALVTGQVENPDGRMRAGQFVTATIELPAIPGEVEVPIASVVEDGEEAVVFVQPDEGDETFVMRRVELLRRNGPVAYVRSIPGAGDSPGGDARPLGVGDRVVSSGAIELKAALLGLLEAEASDP